MTESDTCARSILLVTDQPAAAAPLTAYLSRHGFSVIGQATDACEAERVARAVTPDLVLVDAAVTDGWAQVVDAVGHALPRRRIAVLAAYWTAGQRLAARSSGVGVVLLKRVGEGELARQLEALAVAP